MKEIKVIAYWTYQVDEVATFTLEVPENAYESTIETALIEAIENVAGPFEGFHLGNWEIQS